MFIAIEGLDGAGTTTQVELLVERLAAAGLEARATREPSDGPVGAMIRQMLSGRITGDRLGKREDVDRSTLALLFAADRVDHLRTEVEPSLEAGRTVVTDRYYHSSYAYQSTPAGDPGPDLEWVRGANERARTPDLTVFLEASVEVCLSRLADRAKRDVFEERGRLEALSSRYDRILEVIEGEGQPVVRVDAARRRRALADEIFGEVLARL